jgi:pimeloyl-ACP methyl ester carboxylesterase
MSKPGRPRALLVHSGGLSSRQWRRLADALTPAYDVLAPELIGYPKSGVPWERGVPFHFRDDVARLAELLGPGEPAHLIGHSYGGFLALQLALARPELVRSLALYEPVAFGVLDSGGPEDAAAWAELSRLPAYDGARDPDEAWLSAFVGWWQGAGAWEGLAEPARAAFRSVAWKLSEEVRTLGADRTTSARYGTIAQPALLMGGSKTPQAEQRTLARLAACLPHATLTMFPELGHMGPITHAAIVDAAIVQFVLATV